MARTILHKHEQFDLFAAPAQLPTDERDTICQEWRACNYAEHCFSQDIDQVDDPLCLRDAAAKLEIFGRNQRKILAAGFTLVRMNRLAKIVEFVEPAGPISAWQKHPHAPFATYAQTERTVELMCQDPKCIHVTEDNNVIGGQWSGKSWSKLYAAGFEFYRMTGTYAEQSPRITYGSKYWSTWKKFTTAAECTEAWEQLMTTDPLALKG